MKQKIFYFTVFISLLLAPLFFIFGPQKVEAQYGKMQATEVLATKAIKKKIKKTKELPARISSSKIVQVRPQISGIILATSFKEGSYIEQDQQLYEIDPEPYIANLKSAFANLKMAEASLKPVKNKFERYKNLVKSNAISQQELDEVTAEFENKKAEILIKEAELRKAELDYEYTKVYAPISGKIGKSFIDEGSLVSAGQSEPLALITKLSPIVVDISIPSQDYFEIRKEIGDNTKMTDVEIIISGENSPFEEVGKLQFSESIVDESTGSVMMRAIFQNENEKLLPGLFVKARLNLKEVNEILIPQNAASIAPDGTIEVWVIDEKSVVNKRKIEVKRSYENFWIVKSGIKENENIVLEGIQKIRPGAKVVAKFEDKKQIKGPKKPEGAINQDRANNKEGNKKRNKITQEKSFNIPKKNYQEEITKFIELKLKQAKEELRAEKESIESNSEISQFK